MRKLAVVLTVAGITATATVAFAGAKPGSGINGSMHDINAAAGYQGDSLGRTCVFCHTPHNAIAADSLVPLWNHAETTLPVMNPYVWAAPTNAKIAINSDPLIGPSRLCMACHDGTTAVDSHGSANAGATSGSTAMTASYTDALGNTAKRYITDLTVTHPIGFLWADALSARPGEIVQANTAFLAPLDTTNSGTFDTNAAGSSVQGNGSNGASAKKIADTLYGGFMTCATCHDVHNSVNASPQTGHNYNYFLYAQEEGSAICLSCHVK